MFHALINKVKTIFPTKQVRRLSPKVVPRNQHNISRNDISEYALKVLYRLKKKGFEAYLVGGCVRDLLIGQCPKDFDVVTNAHPEQIQSIFNNCRLIGRRFKLAHIIFGREYIEVATFRKPAMIPSETHTSDDGMILRDNTFGTIEEDVWRRDYTVNAIYYNIADYSLVDYTGGVAALRKKRITMIGDPVQRFREDPVRMLRAVRFAAKLDFKIDRGILQGLSSCKDLLKNVAPARMFEEFIKLFHTGCAKQVYLKLQTYHLLSFVFPQTAACMETKAYPTNQLLETICENTDRRVHENKRVTPAFILSAMLWHPICQETQRLVDEGQRYMQAHFAAIENVIQKQLQVFSVPKRIVHAVREICQLQLQLNRRRTGKQPFSLMLTPRFRAGYDFLLMRAQAGESVGDLSHWWQSFVEGDNKARTALVRSVNKSRRRNKPKKKTTEQNQ